MTFVVTAEDAGRRLDVYIAENAGITRSRAGALIKQGALFVGGAPETKAGYALRAGDTLEFNLPEAAPARVVAQDIALDILYEDADMAVVYKPSGMVVHPAAGNRDGTMVNALLKRLSGLSGIGGEIRPGIVHRIDKYTSGLLLVAKHDASHVSLSNQIKAHSVERAYKAIVIGRMRDLSGFVDAPIGRHPSDRKRMAIVPGGRHARTDWRVLEELRGCTLIECRLSTGRTHQIRVHMASIGHPVLGDTVYGPKKPPIQIEGGQLLHAYLIGCAHPTTGEKLVFTAEPEARFTDALNKLRCL